MGDSLYDIKFKVGKQRNRHTTTQVQTKSYQSSSKKNKTLYFVSGLYNLEGCVVDANCGTHYETNSSFSSNDKLK